MILCFRHDAFTKGKKEGILLKYLLFFGRIMFITKNLIWTEGREILAIATVVAILGFFVWIPIFWATLIFLLWSLYFFRNPDRSNTAAEIDSSLILCPADGRVVDIFYDAEKSLEGNFAYRISIFLSAFDVHVNRAPIKGVVTHIKYKPGAFKPAFLPKSSHLNEHNDIVIEDSGKKIRVRQIAGLIARRIRCWVKKDEELRVGQSYGMIKFGSRVDIFLPENVRIDLKKGNYVYGGKTVLGRWIR